MKEKINASRIAAAVPAAVFLLLTVFCIAAGLAGISLEGGSGIIVVGWNLWPLFAFASFLGFLFGAVLFISVLPGCVVGSGDGLRVHNGVRRIKRISVIFSAAGVLLYITACVLSVALSNSDLWMNITAAGGFFAVTSLALTAILALVRDRANMELKRSKGTR